MKQFFTHSLQPRMQQKAQALVHQPRETSATLGRMRARTSIPGQNSLHAPLRPPAQHQQGLKCFYNFIRGRRTAAGRHWRSALGTRRPVYRIARIIAPLIQVQQDILRDLSISLQTLPHHQKIHITYFNVENSNSSFPGSPARAGNCILINSPPHRAGKLLEISQYPQAGGVAEDVRSDRQDTLRQW